MTDAEFRHYIVEQRLQGRSDSQIARSLGMSLRHMIGRLNGVNVDKIDPPKPKTPKQETRAEAKPVSGAKQPEKYEKAKKEKKIEPPKAEVPKEKEKEKAEDFSWME